LFKSLLIAVQFLFTISKHPENSAVDKDFTAW